MPAPSARHRHHPLTIVALKSRRDLLALVTTGVGVVLLLILLEVDWQAVGAIAAAAGSIAAWRAAVASERTSRDALLALALAIRPHVEVVIMGYTRGDPSGPMKSRQRFLAHAYNTSREWDALDVEVEVEFRDGRRVQERCERLAPSGDAKPRPFPEGDYFEVDLGEPLGPQSIHEAVRRVTVRYFDSRRICRYEWRREYFFERKQEGSITSESSSTEVHEVRISGP